MGEIKKEVTPEVAWILDVMRRHFRQHHDSCHNGNHPGARYSDCIGSCRDVMHVLAEYGLMEIVQDGPGRNAWGYFPGDLRVDPRTVDAESVGNPKPKIEHKE